MNIFNHLQLVVVLIDINFVYSGFQFGLIYAIFLLQLCVSFDLLYTSIGLHRQNYGYARKN